VVLVTVTPYARQVGIIGGRELKI